MALDHTPGTSPDFEPGTQALLHLIKVDLPVLVALAMVHLAMFDALNAIEDEYVSYVGSGINAQAGASTDAAGVFAAARMLHDLYLLGSY